MIYSLYLCGYSPKNIAEILNAEGFVTKASNPFSAATIYGILRNEKYTGVYIFNRSESRGYDHKRNSYRSKPPEEIIRIEGGIPAIISKEIWLAVQERMKNKMYKCRNTKTMYLLSGKIFCGECGKLMHGTVRHRKNANNFYTYCCNNRKQDCCNPKEIDKESLESYVVDLVQNHCLTSSEDQQDFANADRNTPRFRHLLQTYIRDVIVHKDVVIVHLITDGKSKSFQHERKAFRTPTQRCFK